MSKLYKN